MKHELLRYEEGVLVEHTIDGVVQLFKPIPKEWPLWAKALKRFAKPEDKGIGDVAARMIGDENSEAFAKFFEATFNRKCGCKGRRAQWNRLYPLP